MAKAFKWKTNGKKKENVTVYNYGNFKTGGGGIYCLGFIGAAIYYVQIATGFWSGVLGVLKALVWPAFLVYKLLGI